MKVFVDQGFPFDKELFFSKFEEETNPFAADICIFFSTYRYDVGKERSIMIQCEPPIAGHRLECYGTSNRFHTVYTFDPDPDASNQFPLAANNPGFFPYYARQDLAMIPERSTLTDRSVYFASSRFGFEKTPDSFGAVNLYPVREQIVRYLIGHHPQMVVYGSGWGTKDTGMYMDAEGCGDWRIRKLQEMDYHDVDFTLCVESCRLRNYISEKIWDGFNSGRCVLYLGSPNIDEIIPEDCFYNLSKYVDWDRRTIDYEGILNLIQTITPEEYQRTVLNGREWYASVDSDGKYREDRKALTEHVMERIS